MSATQSPIPIHQSLKWSVHQIRVGDDLYQLISLCPWLLEAETFSNDHYHITKVVKSLPVAL